MTVLAQVANAVETADISSIRPFSFVRVIDLRNDPYGAALPVEEELFRRMRYQFISYEQRPLRHRNGNPAELIQFAEEILEQGEKVLVVTHEVEAISVMLEANGVRVFDPESKTERPMFKAPEWTWRPVAAAAFG